MKQRFIKRIKHLSLGVMAFAAFFSANAEEYTLTADDVSMSSNTITACSYDYSQGDTIVIPAQIGGEDVLTIGAGSFDADLNIQGVVISEGITTIEASAFAGSKAISTIGIPASVTSIGDNAFFRCQAGGSGAEVIFAGNSALTTIGTSAFAQTMVKNEVVWPAGLLTIGANAFQYHKLVLTDATIYLPAGVEEIGANAFMTNKVTVDGLVLPGGPENEGYVSSVWEDSADPSVTYRGGDIVTNLVLGYTRISVTYTNNNTGIKDTIFVKNLIPDIDDFNTRQNNFDIINHVIDTVGVAGGGIIKIPAGTFYIGPNLVEGDGVTDPNNPRQAVLIEHSNITLCGAGRDLTQLRTNGTFVAKAWVSSFSGHATYPGGRGNGIWIMGSADKYNPVKNIVLKDFTIDGQAGWTGNYTVDYNNGSDNGWDMWHKGILTTGDANETSWIDSLTIENVTFSHFRGEILYGGGEKLGRLYLKNIKSYGTNASTCNVHASELIVEDSEFGSDVEIDEDGDGNNDNDCRFWIEITGRQYSSENQTHKALFKNNIFRGGNVGEIAICQGDYKEYEIEFTENDFDANGNDLFSIMGGIHGPVKIHDNVINNVGIVLNGNILGGGVAPGAEKRNSNVYFENNTITNGGALIAFSGPADHFYVRNNSFSGKSLTKSHSLMWVNGDNKVNFYYDNVVEGNSFTNCMYPRNRSGWPAIDYDINTPVERPLMVNNTYTDPMTKTEGQNIYNISSATPKVQPNYEEVEIYADADGVVVDLDVFAYADEQVIRVYGGAADKRVKFATGNSTYVINSDMFLDGTNELTFRYIEAAKIWMESSSDTYSVTGVAIAEGTTASAFIDDQLQLNAVIYPAYAANRNVTWSSNNEAVATVDANGLVTGVLAGEADITVTTEDNNKQAVITIKVVTPIRWLGRYKKGLTVTNESYGLENGGVIIDTDYIEGGSGNYAFSLGALQGMTYWDITVDIPLWETNNIQASNEFTGLKGIRNSKSGINYSLIIYDQEDQSLTCNTDSTGANIGFTLFGTDALEMDVDIDGVTFDGNNATGEVVVAVSGGAGGTYNLYGSNKPADNCWYYLTVVDISVTPGDTVSNHMMFDDNSLVADILDTVIFDAPSANFEIIITDQYGGTVSTTIDGGIVESIGDIDSNEHAVSVFPNPTDGVVNVVFDRLPEEKTTLRVLNYLGQLVLEKPAYSSKEQIDLSNQTSGLYFINISGGNTNKTIKVFVR